MNERVNLALQYFFNALYTAMWFAVLNLSLTKRYSRKITYLIQALWFLLYRVVTIVLPFMSKIRVVVFIAIFFAVALICYKDAWTKVMFYSAVVYVVVIANELIGAGLYFPEEIMQGNMDALKVSQLVEFWGIYLSTGAILFFLLYIFLNRHNFDLSTGDWSLFTLFPLSQYVLLYGWLDSLRLFVGWEKTFFFMVATFICIFADIGLFIAVMRLAQRANLAAENDVLAAQIDAQEKHYQALTAQYENIRRMRHDIANHIGAMKSLLASGHSSDAQEYLEELISNPLDSTLGMCKNPVVDSFLRNKIEEARAAGVDVKVNIELEADIPVSNVDLIRIFGNLIDNSLEACKDIKNPKMSIVCSKTHGCLVIITRNPVGPEKPGKSRKIPGLDRGIGKLVLSDVAKKYNGSIRFSKNENIFTTELIIGIGA